MADTETSLIKSVQGYLQGTWNTERRCLVTNDEYRPQDGLFDAMDGQDPATSAEIAQTQNSMNGTYVNGFQRSPVAA